MEKETKTTQSSFTATKRWQPPTVKLVAFEPQDIATVSANQRDVLVDDQVWDLDNFVG